MKLEELRKAAQAQVDYAAAWRCGDATEEMRSASDAFNVDGSVVVGLLETIDSQSATIKALTEVIELVRGIVVDGAYAGFNCHSGDWADRLFASQADTFKALAQAREDE